jgi:hypothetical protein
VGNTVESGGLRQLAHLFLAEIVRDDHIVAPVSPTPGHRAGDVLVFTGDLTRLDLLLRFDGLETRGQHYHLPLDNLVEVVVAAKSPLARARSSSRLPLAVRRRRDRRAARQRSACAGRSPTVPLDVGDTLVLVVGRTSTSATTCSAISSSSPNTPGAEVHRPRKGWLATGRLRADDRCCRLSAWSTS